MRDHEIIEMYWARNENAIAATAEKYGNYCHTIAYNILHNREDAEECSNDTYLGAWNSIPPQRPNRLSIYLGKITRNLALNRNIFVRRYYHLYAIRDIADTYGMSESKVASQLFRMRNELKRFLEKEGIVL